MNAPIRDAFDCSSRRKPVRRHFVSRFPRALLSLSQKKRSGVEIELPLTSLNFNACPMAKSGREVVLMSRGACLTEHRGDPCRVSLALSQERETKKTPIWSSRVSNAISAIYREDTCLQTLLLIFKCANHGNKRPFVATNQ